MTSYILKKNEEAKDVLLYQETSSYSFTPKKNFKWVKKVTVLDEDMLNAIWGNKLNKEYERLLKIVYVLISSDDTTSGDVLVAYTEINRIKEYLENLMKKRLDKKIYEKYKQKLFLLELELKKVHVMELEDEIEEERGMSR